MTANIQNYQAQKSDLHELRGFTANQIIENMNKPTAVVPMINAPISQKIETAPATQPVQVAPQQKKQNQPQGMSPVHHLKPPAPTNM